MIQSVCVFGDSVSKGVVFDSVQNKYTLLKNSFANMLVRNAHISIDNYSKFGCTVTKGGEVLKKHREDLRRYDYTVLEFGGNDCDLDWASVAAAPDSAHPAKTPVSVFEESYSELIDTVKKCGGNPVLLSLPPIDAKKYFAWVSRGLNADNILKFLGDIEFIYRWHEMYNLAVYRLAIAHRVPLVDISSAFLKTENYQNLICEDGIHPNEGGHRLIGDTISEYIRSLNATPMSPEFAS